VAAGCGLNGISEMSNSSVRLQNVADWYIRHCCARPKLPSV
jgi:hypothetical protein